MKINHTFLLPALLFIGCDSDDSGSSKLYLSDMVIAENCRYHYEYDDGKLTGMSFIAGNHAPTVLYTFDYEGGFLKDARRHLEENSYSIDHFDYDAAGRVQTETVSSVRQGTYMGITYSRLWKYDEYGNVVSG